MLPNRPSTLPVREVNRRFATEGFNLAECRAGRG
jgi:hypothetical protein